MAGSRTGHWCPLSVLLWICISTVATTVSTAASELESTTPSQHAVDHVDTSVTHATSTDNPVDVNKEVDVGSDEEFAIHPTTSSHTHPEHKVKLTETTPVTRGILAVEPTITTQRDLTVDGSETVSVIPNRNVVERYIEKQNVENGTDTVSGRHTTLPDDPTNQHGTTMIALTRNTIEQTVTTEHGANRTETITGSNTTPQTMQVDRAVNIPYIISVINTTSRPKTSPFVQPEYVTDGVAATSVSPTTHTIEPNVQSGHAVAGTETTSITTTPNVIGTTVQLKHTTIRDEASTVKHSTRLAETTLQLEHAANGTDTTSDANTKTTFGQTMKPEHVANESDGAKALHTISTVHPISRQEYVTDETESISVAQSTRTIQPAVHVTQSNVVTHVTRIIDTIMLPDNVDNVSKTTTVALTTSTGEPSMKPEHYTNRIEPTSTVDATLSIDEQTDNASTEIKIISAPAIVEEQIEQPEEIRGKTPVVNLRGNNATTTGTTLGAPTTRSGDTTTSLGNTFTTAARPTSTISTTRTITAPYSYTSDAREIRSNLSPTRRAESTAQHDKASSTNTPSTHVTESTTRPVHERNTAGTIATTTDAIDSTVQRVDAFVTARTTSNNIVPMTQPDVTPTYRKSTQATPTQSSVQLKTESGSTYVTGNMTLTTPVKRHLEQTTDLRVTTVSSIRGNDVPTTISTTLTIELGGVSLEGETDSTNHAASTVESTVPLDDAHTANDAVTDSATLSSDTSTTQNGGESTSETPTSGDGITSTGDHTPASHTTTSAGNNPSDITRVYIKVTLLNATFSDDITNNTSEEYESLKTAASVELKTILDSQMGDERYQIVDVTFKYSISNCSVAVHYVLSMLRGDDTDIVSVIRSGIMENNGSFAGYNVDGEAIEVTVWTTIKYHGQFRVPSLTFKSSWSNTTSPEYTDLAQQVNNKLHNLFRDGLGTKLIDVTDIIFTMGSVVVDFSLWVQETVGAYELAQIFANHCRFKIENEAVDIISFRIFQDGWELEGLPEDVTWMPMACVAVLSLAVLLLAIVIFIRSVHKRNVDSDSECPQSGCNVNHGTGPSKRHMFWQDISFSLSMPVDPNIAHEHERHRISLVTRAMQNVANIDWSVLRHFPRRNVSHHDDILHRRTPRDEWSWTETRY